MFLYIDTKFKQELNTQNINREQLEKPVMSMVVDGGRAFLSNQGTATNGCEEGHNHGRDLTKGEFQVKPVSAPG